MNLKFLLDTSIVSAPIKKVPDPRVTKMLDQHGAACAIASPVWHELVYGCKRMPTGARRDAVERYLRTVVQASFPVLPYDEVAAAWHATELARLEDIGKTRPFVDGQIAAIAQRNALTLVTANPRDFVGFKDLTLANWSG